MHDANPVTSAALDAVGGCTRALAGTVDTDAPFGTADAATVGSLRAFGDRIAVRQRFQDTRVHVAARPSDPVAASIFDSLTLARLDALGSQWLPGIAANLLAHPGADDDGVRWLAFGLFSGLEPPAGKQAAAGRVRAALPSGDAATLRNLATLLTDEPAFVELAASWSTRVAKPLQRVLTTGAPAPLPFSLRRKSNDIRRGRYARPGSGRRVGPYRAGPGHRHSTRRNSSIEAIIVPPVAIKSSITITRWPRTRASLWISTQSRPYSSSYS